MLKQRLCIKVFLKGAFIDRLFHTNLIYALELTATITVESSEALILKTEGIIETQ